MNLLQKIREVLEAEPNENQLDKFLADLRDSLAASNKQFLSLNLLALTAAVVYHLVVFEGVAIASFEGLPLAGSSLVQKVFLVVPAALLAAASGVGLHPHATNRANANHAAISRWMILMGRGWWRATDRASVPAAGLPGGGLDPTDEGAAMASQRALGRGGGQPVLGNRRAIQWRRLVPKPTEGRVG